MSHVSSTNRKCEIPDTEKVWCVFSCPKESTKFVSDTNIFYSPTFGLVFLIAFDAFDLDVWKLVDEVVASPCFYDVFWMFVVVKKGSASLCIVYPLLLGLFNSRRWLHCLTDSVGEFVIIFVMILARNVPMHNFWIMYLHIIYIYIWIYIYIKWWLIRSFFAILCTHMYIMYVKQYAHIVYVYIYTHTHYLHSSLGYGSKNGTTFNTFPGGCTTAIQALRCMAFVCWPPVLLASWLVANVVPAWHVTSRITASSSVTPSRRHRVWRSLEKDTISRFWKTGQFWQKMVCIFGWRLVNTS